MKDILHIIKIIIIVSNTTPCDNLNCLQAKVGRIVTQILAHSTDGGFCGGVLVSVSLKCTVFSCQGWIPC